MLVLILCFLMTSLYLCSQRHADRHLRMPRRRFHDSVNHLRQYHLMEMTDSESEQPPPYSNEPPLYPDIWRLSHRIYQQGIISKE